MRIQLFATRTGQGLLSAAALLFCATVSARAGETLDASARAAELDKQIDWSRAELIAVQDGGRYKTLDSFARESMAAMYGREHLPGLSPMASLMEWLFNRNAYQDEPVVRIKDKGLRIDFSTHMPKPQRDYIIQYGYMTPKQLQDPVVQDRMQELEPRAIMAKAMGRVRDAQFVANALERMLVIVPATVPAADAPWHLPSDLIPNLPEALREQIGARDLARLGTSGQAIEGLSPERAQSIFGSWAKLALAWPRADAAGVQKALDTLAEELPAVAAPGVYPSQSQRAAEARYYAMGKFTFGWTLYFLSGLIGAFALITGWRWPWGMALGLLLIAMGFHAYGLSLRWYILGRIPVANMFEAVVASAWIGIACALVAELVFRTRVFVFGAAMTGFFALILGAYVIPGGGTITSIMGILDDIMLRIHTVLIIASYAMIFLASVIAVIYLYGYYYHTAPVNAFQMGIAGALMGGILWVSERLLFQQSAASGVVDIVKRPGAAGVFWVASVLALLLVATLVWRRAAGMLVATTSLVLISLATLAIGNEMFVRGVGQALLGCGVLLSAGTGIGLLARQLRAVSDTAPILAPAGVPLSAMNAGQLRAARPIMAGGAPGDEALGAKLPAWLHAVDWSHLIMLNLVFVLLFVGTILGAVWADYSWGRPWGWDPKEVFALNTWLVYAVLIHTRFLVKNKGVWTAWLSVAGCLMMAFNWCYVNFFIVGMHSYA